MELYHVILHEPSSPLHLQAVDITISDAGMITGVHPSKSPRPEGPLLRICGGWTDCLADYREPGQEHKETIRSGLAAAAAGGFTDILLAPNTSPPTGTKSSVQYLLTQAAGMAAKLHPMGLLSRDLEGKALAEMLDMHAHGAVAFSDGWQPVQSTALLSKALEYVRAFNGVVVQIPTDEALAAGGLMHEGEASVLLGLSGIPAEAEELMVHRDITLAEYTKSRLHLSGISTRKSAALVAEAKARGAQITCSVTPYHLALNADALQGYDSNFKVSPPLRPEADRLALIEALANGTVDCIASHHRPQDWDAKNKELEYAGWGMAVQELTFPIIWNAVQGSVTLERLLDALSTRPRQIFGLPQNSIAEGLPAYVTVFTTDASTELPLSAMQSKAWNNPFAGARLEGKVLGVFSPQGCTFKP